MTRVQVTKPRKDTGIGAMKAEGTGIFVQASSDGCWRNDDLGVDPVMELPAGMIAESRAYCSSGCSESARLREPSPEEVASQSPDTQLLPKAGDDVLSDGIVLSGSPNP